MTKSKHLRDVYRFTNFVPESSVTGIFGDPMALVIRLRRRQKKHFAGSAGEAGQRHTIKRSVTFVTSARLIDVFICVLNLGELPVTSATA